MNTGPGVPLRGLLTVLVLWFAVFAGEKKTMTLTEQDKTLLLQTAQASLEAAVNRRPLEIPWKLPESLKEHCGAFVTLKTQGALRGCIGHIFPVSPLHETVAEMARAAALHDTRFSPVRPDELAGIDIEISVLTPPEDADSYKEFVAGRHGIVITLNRRQAVFLPQVATEQGWDRETTLRHLCLKAGLAPDDWKNPDMRFQLFEAVVFGE